MVKYRCANKPLGLNTVSLVIFNFALSQTNPESQKNDFLRLASRPLDTNADSDS